MLKPLVFIFFLYFFQTCYSQNLVENSSFETYSDCPLDNTFYASEWYRVVNHNGTVDYLNICAPFSYVSVPANYFGIQEPYEGNAYIGLSCYHPLALLREYIQTKLVSPLIAGKFYKISFFVSLTDTSTHAINNIGAAITNIPITGNNSMQPLDVSPQANSSMILSDKVNWTEISGIFKASGGEEFLTLGNFYSDLETSNKVVTPSNDYDYQSYYFIDFVKVIETEEPISESNCLIFSNPVYDILSFENSSNIENNNLVIYDMTGKTINRKINNNQVYLGDLQDGIYIIHYVCDTKNQQKKIIKL